MQDRRASLPSNLLTPTPVDRETSPRALPMPPSPAGSSSSPSSQPRQHRSSSVSRPVRTLPSLQEEANPKAVEAGERREEQEWLDAVLGGSLGQGDLVRRETRLPTFAESLGDKLAMTGGLPRQARPSSPPIALQESPFAFSFPTPAPPTPEAPLDPLVAPSDLESDQAQTGANVWRRTSTGSTSSASSSSRPSSVVSLHGMFATSSSHPSLDTLQPQPELSASSSDEGHRISQPPTILKSFDPNIAYRSSAYSPTSPTTPIVREPLEMEYSEGTHLKGVAGKMSAAERRKRNANLGRG